IEESLSSRSDGSTILKEDPASPAPWLDDLMKQAPGSSALLRLIRQSGKRWSANYVVMSSAAAAVFVGWIVWLMVPIVPVAVGAAIAAAAAPFAYLYAVREVRFRRCDALLPEAVDLMARAMRAGHALPSVMEMVGQEISDPLGKEFRIVHEEISLGLPMREAILNLVERVPRDDTRFLATAIV